MQKKNGLERKLKKPSRIKLEDIKYTHVDHCYMQSERTIDVQEEVNALGNTHLTVIDLNKFTLINVLPYLLKELSV